MNLGAVSRRLAALGFGLFVIGSCSPMTPSTSDSKFGVTPKSTGAELETNQNGWVSSGGELYKTSKNPWFLKNVENIQYCIRFDASGMSISLNEVRALVNEAFKYWESEFSPSNITVDGKGVTKLATQERKEIACDGSEDLAFVFGTSPLTEEERAFIGDPGSHLGLTVRTSYDPVQMRGKGFIYIAADQGKDRYHGENDFLRTLWSENLVLLAMLVHELGHVYGFPHTGHTIMAEGFAERLTSVTGFSAFKILNRLPSFLRLQEIAESCMNDLAVFEWFGQGVEDTSRYCLEMRVINEPNASPQEKTKLMLSIVDNETGTQKEIGTLTYSLGMEDIEQVPNPVDFNMHFAGIIFLTPEQQVFQPEDLITAEKPDPNNPEKFLSYQLPFLFTSSPYSYGGAAQFEFLETGVLKQVYLQSAPEGYKIIAEQNGEQRLLFNSTTLQMF